MTSNVIFNLELFKRHDRSGPRYTSYPTAAQFDDDIGLAHYIGWTRHSNEDPIPKPLSLYFHIPFCDKTCYYCACNKVITEDMQLASTYLEDLFREIELQSTLFDPDRIVDQLHFGGGTPTYLDNEQITMLMDKISQHFRLHDDDYGEYSIEIDPRSTDANTIKYLRKLGFNRLSLGVQDFDPAVQQAINRVQSAEQVQAILVAARQARYKSVNIDLIYGLPLQTRSKFSATLETLIELNPDRISLYNYIHLPERFTNQQLISDDDLPSEEERLEILQQSIERLTAVGYVYIGMDHFARPLDELAVAQRNGSLHRNFQGYSAHSECDTIAMGVSAIGNIGDHYYQNTVDFTTYHEKLQDNLLPIHRGCETEQNDILRRDIIQQLICHFRLDIRSIERRWNIDFATAFANELSTLQKMEQDGLIKLSRDAIIILDGGRLLVRRICMVFDRYITLETCTTESVAMI